jgi:hypothetical protein
MSATIFDKNTAKLMDAKPSSIRSVVQNVFASSVICWMIILGTFLADQRLPPAGSGMVITVFSPHKTAGEITGAVHAAGGAFVRATRYGKAWVVASDRAGFVGRLKKTGAVASFAPIGPIGSLFIGSQGLSRLR